MASEDILKRIEALEEKQRQQGADQFTLLGIVKDIDRTVGSIQAHEMVLDGRLDTVDGRLNLMHRDMNLSFHQVNETMATRAELDDLREQVLLSFKQMLAILDERLPKKQGGVR